MDNLPDGQHLTLSHTLTLVELYLNQKFFWETTEAQTLKNLITQKNTKIKIIKK